jgi:hypothetical protein
MMRVAGMCLDIPCTVAGREATRIEAWSPPLGASLGSASVFPWSSA